MSTAEVWKLQTLVPQLYIRQKWVQETRYYLLKAGLVLDVRSYPGMILPIEWHFCSEYLDAHALTHQPR